jgi:hypothetical protein
MTIVRHLLLVASVILPTSLVASSLSNNAYGQPIALQDDYCMVYYTHGTYCDFASYAQCAASASGIGGECFWPRGSRNVRLQDGDDGSELGKLHSGDRSKQAPPDRAP